MPMLFLQELEAWQYPLDRNRDYNQDYLPVKDSFTFSPLNKNNYLLNQEVKTDEVDVFNVDTIKEYAKRTDNNNGGMIIELTQKFYEESGKPKTYGDCLDIKISFVLGYEECYFYHDKLSKSVLIEEEFSRLVNSKEFIEKTFRSGGKENEKFHKCFKYMLQLFGVKEVYDRKGKKAVEDRLEFLTVNTNVITKDVTGTIEPPTYLLLTSNPYK